jgi:putative hemolysin
MRVRPVLFPAVVVMMFGGLAACGSDAESPDTTGSGQELANPASVFCVEQGGTVEIVDEADGQVGYCNLPDGTSVDEWEYFRAEGGGATSQPVTTET